MSAVDNHSISKTRKCNVDQIERSEKWNASFQTCRPKELLIGLLEQLEQDDPDTIAESLHLLLSPLQKGKDYFSMYILQCICQLKCSNFHRPPTVVCLPLSAAKPGQPQGVVFGYDAVHCAGPGGQTASTSHQGARGGRCLLAVSLLHRSHRLCQTLCAGGQAKQPEQEGANWQRKQDGGWTEQV